VLERSIHAATIFVKEAAATGSNSINGDPSKVQPILCDFLVLL